MRSTTQRHEGGRPFVRHYLEMVVAMVVGMATLYPAWAAAARSVDVRWLSLTEIEALAMATAMAVPMAAWMVARGHGSVAAVEMCLAMYAGFVVLFPLLWSDLVGPATLLGLGHVAMLLLMALVMVRHLRSTTTGTARRQVTGA